MVGQFSHPYPGNTVTTLTRNLKLRLSDDLSGDARYNLERIDQLGAAITIDTVNNSVIRSANDIQFRPEDNSIGGSGVGGEVEFGDINQRLSSASINGPLKLLSSVSGNNTYLTVLNSNTADRTLTINTGNSSFTLNLPITNAEISVSAAISDTKLATISTAGKVSNSATTATNSNINNAIVARDSSGNFLASTITASLVGNVTGNVTGSLFGNADTATAAANLLDSNLSGDVTNVANFITVVSVGGKTASEVALSIVDTQAATENNTANTLVKRDASGDFFAGIITASLVGNVTGNVSGTSATFTGSLTGDIISTGMATAIAPGVIVDGDVSASAAISGTKVSPVFGNQLVSSQQGFDIIGGTYTTSLREANTPATNVVFKLPATNGATNAVLITDGAGNTSWSTLAGSGTVTSVDMTVPSILTISGNPITTTGTLALDLATQAANTVLAGPATGPSSIPAFRQLSTDDLTEGSNLFYTDGRAKGAAVVNSTSGNETDQAASVSAMKSYVTNNIPNIAQAQIVYVNKNQTGSYTPDGSIGKPYLNIKAALDAITDASAAKKYALIIAPGDYVENSAIRLKGWIDIISAANDTVTISTSDSSRLKWSNNNPGRVFITRIGLSSGIEVLNDNPSGTSGIVLDLNNCDVASIVMNGRGGGRDYIQLRNDTRVSGTTTINSAATTIFDSTLIGTLTMTDTGCVTPDVYGSAITATLRSNYQLNITITNTTYDIYTDAWGNSPIGTLSITSNSSYPSTFNTDYSSYPATITLSGSPAPVLTQTILGQVPTKSSPVGSDVVLIADSAANDRLKKIPLSAIVEISGGSYASDWTSGTSIALTHGLNSRDVLVEVYDKTTYETVLLDSVVRTDVNTVTITSSTAPSGAGYRALIKRI